MKKFEPFEIDTNIEIKHKKTTKKQATSNPNAKSQRRDEKTERNENDKKAPRSPRRTRNPKRRAALRRRRFFTRLGLILIFILVLAGAFKKLSFSNKAKDSQVPQANLGRWYIGKILEEKRGVFNQEDTFYNNALELSTIAQDSMVNFENKLMPGSAHLIKADKYAYKTKEIREYIRGEKTYTGDDKLVFLTFDDGPNRTITPQVLKILQKEKVRGTFFLIGRNMTNKNIPVMKAIINNGNSIALHSYSHDYDSLYPDKKASTLDILSEAKLSAQRLQEIFGENFHSGVWRYPGGHMSWDDMEAADKGLSDMGIEWIDWNSLAGDAEIKSLRPETPEGMIQYTINSLNKNVHNNVAVVLMHDAINKQVTVNALPGIIKYFKDNNYKFCILK